MGARAALPAGGSLSPDVAAPFGPGGDDARPLVAARLASHRLAHLARRVTSGRGGQVPPEIRDLVEAHREFHPKAEIGALLRAYEAAERFHHGQMRRSGDPYIIHPIAVAEILAELGVDTTTLVAALLHDTVEDTGATLEILADEFGDEVANLVDGVTKLDKMRFGEAAEAETLRKLIVALARDYRVLLIKIADRLHNMRTLGFMSPAKQAKISQVTQEILAPLAHRLGVSVIKRELEDRAFEVLNPEDYRRTQALVDDFTASERESGALAAVVSRLRTGLAEAKIGGDVSVRNSHLFSIHKRAQERGRPPRDYYDIVRVLVLVDNVWDCYGALGVIHGLWRPVPGRLRDFVATPKFNMYQSLHTTVTDATGRAVDIQIRTPQMHVLAETGIVARPVGEGADGARLEGLSWLHSLLDWEGEAKDPREFLEVLSNDLESDEVLAFTPKGKAIALPARSSPVDVAYAVHTDIGHRAIGARVNGRLVPLHTRLRNGDVVEILTSNLPQAGPSEDWLSFVKTGRARVRIRRRLARGRREAGELAAEAVGPDAAQAAPDAVAGQVAAAASATTPWAAEARAVARDMAAAGGVEAPAAPVTDLPREEEPTGGRTAEAAAGAPPAQARRRSRPAAAAVAGRRPAPAQAGMAELDGGAESPVRIARCCLPLPEDSLVGFLTHHGAHHNNAVTLHRAECANARPDRGPGSAREAVRVLRWHAPAEHTFPAEIAVEAFDRYGLLADITEVLADTAASLRAASTSTSEDGVAHARFTVEVTGLSQLDEVLAAVRTVGGVYDSYRACQTPAP